MNCLVIDHDTEAVRYIEGCLQNTGWTYNAVYTGSAGVGAFARKPHHYDLVIMELLLPDTSGIFLAQSFKEIRKDIEILFYSYHPPKGPSARLTLPLGKHLEKCLFGTDLIDYLRRRPS